MTFNQNPIYSVSALVFVYNIVPLIRQYHLNRDILDLVVVLMIWDLWKQGQNRKNQLSTQQHTVDVHQGNRQSQYLQHFRTELR